MRCEYRNNKLKSRRSGFQNVSIAALTIAAGAWMMSAGVAAADDASVTKLEKEMHRIEALHQAEIHALQAQIKHLRREHAVHYTGGPVIKGPQVEPALPFVTMTPGHEFGLSSADGQNTINFTGRVHFDVGGYTNYRPMGTTATKTPDLGSPVANFRRARIGVQGKFMGDWNYALIYDFGGTSDGFGGSAAGSLPGGAASGIENAFIQYNGFYNHHQPFPVSITLGAIDVPWTLSESMSSNDLLMMERASPQVFATSFGGSDGRTAIGATSNDNNYFVGAWLTGPTTGALHTAGTSGLGPTYAVLTRAAYTLTPTPDSTLHLGFNYSNQFAPRTSTNLEALSLSDRTEVRLDPNGSFVGTGTIPASGGQVFGAEAAASFQNAFIQGEYYHYIVDTRIGTAPTTLEGGTSGPSYAFNGGYVEASYTIGGKRHYNPASGGYSGVVPEHPLAWGSDGWGALEAVGTFSVIDANSGALEQLIQPGSGYTAYSASKQTAFGGGLNWYPNLNMKFMLDYEHVVIDKPVVFNGPNLNGATVDWIAARTQFMW